MQCDKEYRYERLRQIIIVSVCQYLLATVVMVVECGAATDSLVPITFTSGTHGRRGSGVNKRSCCEFGLKLKSCRAATTCQHQFLRHRPATATPPQHHLLDCHACRLPAMAAGTGDDGRKSGSELDRLDCVPAEQRNCSTSFTTTYSTLQEIDFHGLHKLKASPARLFDNSKPFNHDTTSTCMSQ